jgi:hypothetical protein
MSHPMTLSQVIDFAEQLPAQEQKQLADVLLREAGGEQPVQRAGRKWSENRGSAEYPLCGEDAQQWVSRTRAESDEHRDARRRSEA